MKNKTVLAKTRAWKKFLGSARGRRNVHFLFRSFSVSVGPSFLSCSCHICVTLNISNKSPPTVVANMYCMKKVDCGGIAVARTLMISERLVLPTLEYVVVALPATVATKKFCTIYKDQKARRMQVSNIGTAQTFVLHAEGQRLLTLKDDNFRKAEASIWERPTYPSHFTIASIMA